MNNLWSPWRSKYIESLKDEDKKKPRECFFCDAYSKTENSRELLVVARSQNCFVMMNKFPYNNGHLLIAPNLHLAELEDLSEEVLAEIMFVIRKAKKVLEKVFVPHGFNIGLNLGRVAGAGVPGHLHFHIVPRWNGDTNFMPVLSEVKVISQSLEDTQEMISNVWKELYGGG